MMIQSSRVSRVLAEWPLGVVVALFVAACWSRLDDAIYLEPDGADFMVLARSLATGQGYRDISEPAAPAHTFRPPGFPLLLVPAALVDPYGVVAAKITVVLCAVIVLILFWCISRSFFSRWASFVLMALFATSPATLLNATDVASEMPYVAFTLAVLLLAIHWLRNSADVDPSQPRGIPKLEIFGWFVLLAFAPLMRMVGLSLIVAAALVALSAGRGTGAEIGRARWRRLLFVLATLIPMGLWWLRNKVVGEQEGYAALYSQPYAGGAVIWIISSVAAYIAALGDFLVWSAPIYVSGPALFLAAIGMWVHRRDAGAATMLYFIVYLLVIAAYPIRDLRLAWPLAPVALVWIARGVQYLFERWRERIALLKIVRPAAGVAVSLWIAWQTSVCGDWIAVSLGWQRASRFASTPLARKPMDWPAAGRWIRQHAEPFARVITRDKSLFFWSRRPQIRVRLESIAVREFEATIRSVRARYIAFGYGNEGASLPLERLERDPVYQLDAVYDAGGVRIYRVGINRSGTVASGPVDFSSLLERLDDDSDGRAAPWRREFLRAHFLRRAGRAPDAIAPLRDLVTRSPDKLTVMIELATCLIDAGNYQEAMLWYRRAEAEDGSDRYLGSIRSGFGIAQQFQRLHDPNVNPVNRAQAGLVIANGHLQMGRYEAALDQLNVCLKIAPAEPNCAITKATVLQRLGRFDEAAEACRIALRSGMREAAPKLVLILAVTAFQRDEPVEVGWEGNQIKVDPNKIEDILNMKSLAVEDGLPGVGVAMLEHACERFPESAELRASLGDLYEQLGEWRLAEAMWSESLELHRDAMLARRRELLRAQMAAHLDP